MMITQQKIVKGEGDSQIVIRPDKATLDEWKAIHGDVHFLLLEKSEDPKKQKVVFVKEPSRLDLGEGMTRGNGNLLFVAIETLKLCMLGGDVELLDENYQGEKDYLSFAALQFQGLVKTAEVELGKL